MCTSLKSIKARGTSSNNKQDLQLPYCLSLHLSSISSCYLGYGCASRDFQGAVRRNDLQRRARPAPDLHNSKLITIRKHTMMQSRPSPASGVVTPASSSSSSDTAQAHPATLPKTLSRSFTVNSIPTHLWIQLFVDRVVIGISQLSGGKIGNFILCQAHPSPVNPKVVDYEFTHLLGAGRDDPAVAVCSRQLMENIYKLSSSSPSSSSGTRTIPHVILGLSLHPEEGKDPRMMRCILDLATQLYQDARG